MNTLNDIFVPYEIAEKLKEIGFNEKCIAYKHTGFENITASTNIKLINKEISVYIDPINYEDLKNDKENTENYLLIPTYEQVFDWFRNKNFYFSCEHSYVDGESEIWYDVVHIELDFYKGTELEREDSDGHYYYSTSAFSNRNFKEVREIMIKKAIDMYESFIYEKNTIKLQ